MVYTFPAVLFQYRLLAMQRSLVLGTFKLINGIGKEERFKGIFNFHFTS